MVNLVDDVFDIQQDRVRRDSRLNKSTFIRSQKRQYTNKNNLPLLEFISDSLNKIHDVDKLPKLPVKSNGTMKEEQERKRQRMREIN